MVEMTVEKMVASMAEMRDKLRVEKMAVMRVAY